MINETVGERIRIRRKELEMSVDALAEKIGKNRATVYRYERGEIENVSIVTLQPLAKALRTTPAYLMGWEETPEAKPKLYPPTITNDFVTFPVLGTIAAGYDEMAAEDWSGDTVEIPVSYLKGRPKSDFFVLSVRGDSMYPLYHNGDKVLILKQNSLDNSGQIGAIIYDDECATLKKIEFVKGEDWLKMIPINPEFMPKTISGVDLEHCRVIGVPKFLIREIL